MEVCNKGLPEVSIFLSVETAKPVNKYTDNSRQLRLRQADAHELHADNARQLRLRQADAAEVE